MNNQPSPGTSPAPQPVRASDNPVQLTPQNPQTQILTQPSSPQYVVVPNQQAQPIQQPTRPYETIFCSTCGQQIAKVALACPFCGAPVYQNQPQQNQQPQQIIINNSNSNSNINANVLRGGGYYYGHAKNKWVAFLLCLFFGFIGAHKFYEGKVGMGVLYLLTCGFFCIGWGIDTLIILFKPNPYFV